MVGELARRRGFAALPVSPYLVLAIAIGLSVEDLSESGGPFLGADDVEFGEPVFVGATLNAASRVVRRRESAKRPAWGVVEWETIGVVADAEVVRFRRTSLVRRRDEH
uniref:Putative dehydratase n=1 Tax=Arthrobacter globiformis TaxID=1665 RepID=B8R4L1_ARTGO|nr:putative dehydratase [Arthrobacter globiformis]